MTNIIAVANQKGGVGKTTTVINLGAYLAERGSRVLLVDLDPQANTTSGLGIDKQALERHIYHGLGDVSLGMSLVQPTAHGLSLLPSHPDLAAAEVELVAEQQREFRLRQLLAAADYDYVLIDCPPSLGLLTINGLTAAQHVIIPVQAEYYALEGLGQLLDSISRVKAGLNPHLDLLGVLLTMHSGRTTLSRQVSEEVSKHFPGKVFDGIIPRNIRLAEAPSFASPINKYDKWSKGARAYKNLAKEVDKRVKK